MNTEDSECPICHQAADYDSPTLTHKSCGRWYDKECLREWIKSQYWPTCPLCQEDLYEIWDLSQHERFHEAIDALEKLSEEPETYHVRRTAAQAVDVIHATIPEIPPEELAKLVSDAIELAMDAIDFASGPTHDYPIERAHVIYDDRDDYKLDAVSIRHLWHAHRVLGYLDWFLLRLPAFPVIGVWLPNATGTHIHPLGGIGSLKLSLGEDKIHELLLRGSSDTILSIPLSTDLLCDRSMPINEIRGHPAGARVLRDLAARHGIEYWCLVDLRVPGSLLDNSGVFAIPWPKDRLRDGFKTQNYFGRLDGKANMSGGWNPEIEGPVLRRFVAQQALMPDHADYLLSRLDGEASEAEAERCRQNLLTTYHITINEDLRLTDDEKWSYSAGFDSNDRKPVDADSLLGGESDYGPSDDEAGEESSNEEHDESDAHSESAYDEEFGEDESIGGNIRLEFVG